MTGETQQGSMPSEAVRAAVEALVGENDAASDGAPADPVTPPEAAQATPTAPPAAVTPPAQDEQREKLRELQAFARAQEKWAGESTKLRERATKAGEEKQREILTALDSDDPDGALERLGLTQEQRRRIVQRMVLRHVPADKADPDLRRQIELDEAKQIARRAEQKLDTFIKQQTEERQRERQEATQRSEAGKALETLEQAFRSAGDGQKLARARYGKRRDVAMRDAIEVGKELAQRGEISTRMSESEIAALIVTRLDERYREDFGLAEPSAPTTPPATQRPTTPQIAAEASAARTISRGQTGATRPPPTGPRSDEDILTEGIAEFARLRREGRFPTAS